MRYKEGEEDEGEKVAGGRIDRHHAEEKRFCPTSYVLALDRKGEKFGDGGGRVQTEITEDAFVHTHQKRFMMISTNKSKYSIVDF